MSRLIKIGFILLMLLQTSLFSQNVGINSTGATPNSSAMLDIDVSALANKKGLLIPRMTAAQKTAMSPLAAPAQGLLIYQTDGVQGFYYNTSSTTTPSWSFILPSNGNNGGWGLSGNSGTVAGTNFIGTTDNNDLQFKIDNTFSGTISKSNVSFGYNAGNFFGSRNVSLGSYAQQNVFGNFDNVAIGYEAMMNASVSSWNIAIGSGALKNCAGAEGSIAIGDKAMMMATSGAGIAIGSSVLYNNTGSANIGLGDGTLINNTSGSFNVAVGFATLRSNVTGIDNIGVGGYSLRNLTGSYNTAIGDSVGYSAITNTYNTYLGYRANASNGITNSTAIGANASVTASNCLVLGNNVNVGIGTTAPTDKLEVAGKVKATSLQITSGASSGLILTSDASGNATWQSAPSPNAWGLTGNAGTTAGTSFIGTTDNVALSFRVNNQSAGKLDKTNRNVFFGILAGNSTTGSNNVLIGDSAGYSNTTGNSNIFIGSRAGRSNTGTFGNIYIGASCGARSTGQHNTYVGSSAGFNNVAGIYNTFFGQGAGSNSTGSYNTLMGYRAGNNAGAYEVMIGYEAGSSATSNGLFIGARAGEYNSGGGNTFLGFEVGRYNTGSSNVFISSGKNHKSGSDNVFIGQGAAVLDTAGYSNTIIGRSAGLDQYDAHDNTFIGNEAGYYERSGFENVAIGSEAGYFIGSTIAKYHSNVYMGHRAAWYVTGSNNTFLGDSTGSITGSLGITNYNVTLLGAKSSAADAITNSTALGFRSRVTASNAIVLGGTGTYTVNVGIGITAPESRFHVEGSETSAHGKNACIQLSNSSSSNNWYFRAGAAGTSTPSGGFSIADDAAYRMVIDAAGNVGIGCTTPSQRLSVSGNIYASGTILASQATTCSSDKRFKKDIRPLENALEKILKVYGVNYYWRTSEFPERGFNDSLQIGFIAQDLEKIFPQMVFTDAQGYKSIDYSRLTPVLVEALKEQQTVIEKQNDELAKMKMLLEQISAKVDAMDVQLNGQAKK